MGKVLVMASGVDEPPGSLSGAVPASRTFVERSYASLGFVTSSPKSKWKIKLMKSIIASLGHDIYAVISC